MVMWLIKKFVISIIIYCNLEQKTKITGTLFFVVLIRCQRKLFRNLKYNEKYKLILFGKIMYYNLNNHNHQLENMEFLKHKVFYNVDKFDFFK